MWQSAHESENGQTVITDERYPTDLPVLVIPLDPATLAKITDKMACAIHNSMHENCVEWGKLQPGSGYYNDAMIQARAALRAVSPHLRRKA